MRGLIVNASQVLVTSEVLLALQLRNDDEPLFPGLTSLVCLHAAGDFIQFIPLFLPPGMKEIEIKFAPNAPILTTALIITKILTLCPHLASLVLNSLPRNPVITKAASEMLLACNRDTLQRIFVDSPLTGDAHEIIYRLPKLRSLLAIIEGSTLLPQAELPNLGSISIQWDSGYEWLQGFRGATIGSLETATFRPVAGSAQIQGFLEEFQSVVLTTARDTLSGFSLCTSQSWTPNYSSLLGFKRLTNLTIQFSCRNGCSSTVDDDIIINLARAMPGLRVLYLGQQPCQSVTGVTFRGLVALASCCLHLQMLRVHLQANSLVEATTRMDPLFSSELTTDFPQMTCALVNLQVGDTPIPEQATVEVALTLLQIFPKIFYLKYANPQWKRVEETIKLSRRVGNSIRHASKTCLPSLSLRIFNDALQSGNTVV